MSDELRGIIPRPYIPPIRPAKYDQLIMVNWLYIEVDATAPKRMPILNRICGHRNIEVFRFVKANMDRWLRDMCEKMYGKGPAPAYRSDQRASVP